MALMVMNTAMKVSPGKDRDRLRSTMMMNIMIDFAVGLVPFLGDVADALFRANTKNAVALEKMLNNRVKALEQGRAGEPVHHTESSSDDDEQRDSRMYVDDASPPSYESAHRHRNERMQVPVGVRKPAKAKTTTRGGWFGGRVERETDVEKGEGDRPPRPPRK